MTGHFFDQFSSMQTHTCFIKNSTYICLGVADFQAMNLFLLKLNQFHVIYQDRNEETKYHLPNRNEKKTRDTNKHTELIRDCNA